MDDDTGETSVKDEMMKVAAHLRFMLQFFGLAGSSGPSQVTLMCQLVSDIITRVKVHTRFGSLVDAEVFSLVNFADCASTSRSSGIPSLISSTTVSSLVAGVAPLLFSDFSPPSNELSLLLSWVDVEVWTLLCVSVLCNDDALGLT